MATPAVMWGDWLCNGPVIVFLIIALEGKKELNMMDQTIIFSFFLCLLCGFMRIIPQPKVLGYIWFAVSCLLLTPTLLLPWYLSNHSSGETVPDIESGDLKSIVAKKQQQKQVCLSVWLIVITQLIGVTFLLSANDVIGPADTVAVFMLLSLVLQGFFAAVVANAHTHALLEVQRDLDLERRANQSRRDFLKYLFHEVRTPLNSLTMGIELLKAKKDGLDLDDREVLAMMKVSSDFMMETLNAVLSMQKIEEGKLELVLAPFSISDSITKISLAMSGGIATKSLRVEKHIAPEVPHLLLGDVYRIEHVISNLLSNAIKFSPPEGMIRMNVEATALPQAGGSSIVNAYSSESSTSITVSITDEGPGISEEHQQRIFEGFFQVRPDKLQQGQGSGLGLSLCKQIVALHGGTIGVDSVEGKGSTFHLTIVFRNAREAEDESSVPKASDIPATAMVSITRDSSTRITSSAILGSLHLTPSSDFSLSILVVDGTSVCMYVCM